VSQRQLYPRTGLDQWERLRPLSPPAVDIEDTRESEKSEEKNRAQIRQISKPDVPGLSVRFRQVFAYRVALSRFTAI